MINTRAAVDLVGYVVLAGLGVAEVRSVDRTACLEWADEWICANGCEGSGRSRGCSETNAVSAGVHHGERGVEKCEATGDLQGVS